MDGFISVKEFIHLRNKLMFENQKKIKFLSL